MKQNRSYLNILRVLVFHMLIVSMLILHPNFDETAVRCHSFNNTSWKIV